MKVTSFKDVESYIYSSVILPLKSLSVNQLAVPSPILSTDGKRVWELRLSAEPLQRNYRRNYQRNLAQRSANTQVILSTGRKEYVVAMFNPKTKWVKVYERPFRILKATPLMGKLYEAFNNNTPFTKVISELDPPMERIFRDRSGHTASSPYGDDEAEEDDYDYGEDDY